MNVYQKHGYCSLHRHVSIQRYCVSMYVHCVGTVRAYVCTVRTCYVLVDISEARWTWYSVTTFMNSSSRRPCDAVGVIGTGVSCIYNSLSP